jgi:hypothetical protein
MTLNTYFVSITTPATVRRSAYDNDGEVQGARYHTTFSTHRYQLYLRPVSVWDPGQNSLVAFSVLREGYTVIGGKI